MTSPPPSPPSQPDHPAPGSHPPGATLRVAVVQAQGYPFATEDAVAEVERSTAAVADRGAELVVFPEAYVGGYPWGVRFGTAVGGRTPEGRQAWASYHAGAVDVPGPVTDRMAAAARQAGVFLVVGVVERDPHHSGGTLFCSLLYFGPDGTLLGIHRKLRPTAQERIIWGEGDGSTLPVIDTGKGRVGGLICWENYMPLARMAMYGKGVEIYLAPTADARPRWQSTLQHIALEGRCFVVGCNQYVTRDMYPRDFPLLHEVEEWPETLCRGGSAVYDPAGECLAGPLWDQDGVLFADLDLGAVVRGKFDFDVTGHYARADVFRLTVDETPRSAVGWKKSGGSFPGE